MRPGLARFAGLHRLARARRKRRGNRRHIESVVTRQESVFQMIVVSFISLLLLALRFSLLNEPRLRQTNHRIMTPKGPCMFPRAVVIVGPDTGTIGMSCCFRASTFSVESQNNFVQGSSAH